MATKNIKIKSIPIRLGQFLKYSNQVQDGTEAKLLIQSGSVKVNGLVDKRRGRQLNKDDSVQVSDGIIFILQ